MPSSKQLAAHGRQFSAEIQRINADETMTASEKRVALEKINTDIAEHREQLHNSERSEEVRKSVPDAADEKDAAEVIAGGGFHLPSINFARRGLAKQVIESKHWKAAVKNLGGTDQTGMREQFQESWELSLKDATSADNLMGEGLYGTTGPTAAGQAPFLPGAFGPGILPQFLPGIVDLLFYRLTLGDVIPSIAATSPNITYLMESTANMESNAVAEAGQYPYSSEEFTRAYEQVGKISNAAKVTDEVILDAAQLFSFVQTRLIQGIQRQEEVQLLAGPGGGVGVNGLLNRSNGFTQSASVPSAGSNIQFPATTLGGTTLPYGSGVQPQTISTLHYGRQIAVSTAENPAAALAEGLYDGYVDVNLAVFQYPNAVIMNPRDWETLRIGKDANGQYYNQSFFGTVYGQGTSLQEQLWGVPVVSTPAIPKGLVLFGWFDSASLNAARLTGVTMQMTNSNVDDFEYGKVTLRAEERLALLVYRPSAFELVQLT